MFLVAKMKDSVINVVDTQSATKAAAEKRAQELARTSDDTYLVLLPVTKYQRRIEVTEQSLG